MRSSKWYVVLLAAVFVLVSSGTASAYKAPNLAHLSKKQQTDQKLYMTAKQAFKKKKAGGDKVLFLDIRTRAEVQYVGWPDIADANVPYGLLTSTWNAKKNRFKRAKNPDFLAAFEARMAEKKLGKGDLVILMCRSGKRSAKAANLLAKAGYTKVYTLVEGFEGGKGKKGAGKGKRVVNGWKNAGLPWSYHKETKEMYVTQ